MAEAVRLLFLSNFYPPNHGGGYEQWCREVAVELTRRGHEVRVLTSAKREQLLAGSRCDPQVLPILPLEVDAGLARTAVRMATGRARPAHTVLETLRRAVTGFSADAALIWGMWNVPRCVPALVEQLLGSRVAYYLCDYWPALPSAHVQHWQAPARHRLAELPKRMLAQAVLGHYGRESLPTLRLEHPICVSRAVRERLVELGVAVGHARIIYGGTRLEEFASVTRPASDAANPRTLRLVCAGRLTATKGVHTAIEALAQLDAADERGVTLDIVGGGDPGYVRDLRARVQALKLGARVRFQAAVPRSAMPRVLGQHDVLLLLSEWQEPFARVVLEGMAAGLVVVGTTTGGSPEILSHDRTGLTVPPGDPAELARQLRRLLASADLRRRLAAAGRRQVEERFTFGGMVDSLEAALVELAGAREAR